MDLHRLSQRLSAVIACLLIGVAGFSQSGAKKPKETELVMSKCWSYQFSDERGMRLTGDEARIFVGLEHGRLNAISTDGKKLWTAELGGEISSNLVATASGLYLTTTAVKDDGTSVGDSILYSLSKDTGVTVWSTKLPPSNVHFVNAYEMAVIVTSAGGLTQSVDQKSGTQRWRREGEPVEIAPEIADTRLLLAGTSKLAMISLNDGAVVSERPSSAAITAIGRTKDGSVVIGDDRGVVTNFSSDGNGVKWKFRSGGAGSAILAVNDRLLFASNDNFIYLILSRQGHVNWRRRMPGRILDIALFTDRWALAGTSDEHSPLQLIDLNNGRLAAQIATGPDESVIDKPFVSGQKIFFLTEAGVYAHSPACPEAKDGGKTDPVPPPS